MQETGINLPGTEYRVHRSLPDTSLRGPMTDEERAIFGEPAHTTTLTIVASANVTATVADVVGGARASDNVIVTAVGFTWVASPDTASQPGKAIGCRGMQSCLDFKIFKINCDRQRWTATVSMSATAWARQAVEGDHEHRRSCAPSGTPPTRIADEGSAGFTCKSEWVKLTVDAGENWVERLATVCTSGTATA